MNFSRLSERQPNASDRSTKTRSAGSITAAPKATTIVSRIVSRQFLRRSLACAVVLGTLSGMSGCRLCCSLEDAAYPSYGGLWERTQRDDGRVGSLFEPGGARSSSLQPRESASDADSRRRIAPFAAPGDDESDPSFNESDPEGRTEEERLKRFQERRDELQEKMLSAEVIPGVPAPPAFR